MCLLTRRSGVLGPATLAAFASGLLLVHLMAPGWPSAFQFNGSELEEAVETYRSEIQRRRELDDDFDQFSSRVGACDSIAVALIDQRITFAAAVDEIDALTRDRPGFEETLLLMYPEVRSRRDLIARHTIDRARRMLAGDPTRQKEVIERLETAYRNMVADD